MYVRWKISLVAALVSIAGFTVVGADEAKELTSKPSEVAPLRNLLALVHERHPGRILEVELEQEGYGEKDIWIYEVKMLTRRGRVYELEYDASTLELLKTEGHPRGH